MKSFKLVGLALLWLGLVGKEHNQNPLFFELPLQIEDSFERIEMAELMEEGFIEPISIALNRDSERPLFYESTIRTTVCDDEICEIMYIKLYWDLVGDYVGYDTVATHPLTKFDHEPFTENDYSKLHELLNNDGSILKFKQKSELIDKEKIKASDVVDGTTGATALEIKDEVVEGALYSSYTLWHLSHSGKIKNMINEHTEKLYDSSLKNIFIASGRTGYKYFVIQRLTDQDYISDTDLWTGFLISDIPLAKKKILNNIPNLLLDKESIQLELAALFSSLDVNSRTVLLNKFQDAQFVYESAIEELSKNIYLMNKNQTNVFLTLIEGGLFKGDLLISNLKTAYNNTKFAYGYLLEDFIKNNYED
ncbi:hypothetical protein LV84_04216 [Algoriphagus ratkowskyi]|uniref:Uncharacterized protein n=1 Tax=Algoriphagus ratkowskyi TaxID=57028 RepID=A0A2W7RG53_9BACT|nr:hypothetical protein [Algoriphagus ratkowskyi]PZX49685.1 hypothetical protein LV84_04216 [Algoriphagus ratkowskyi]TXD75443.1 hypothetical protein ESW18_20455 [Algoriphagus ratkowskyi]